MRNFIPYSLLAMTLSSTSLIGCASDLSEADETTTEEALTGAGAKVIVRNVEYPSGLAVTATHVYFSQNHFVASGDPELDQQMAYWTGKFSRVPLAGGAREKLSDSGIVTVRQSGNLLFGATGDSCWAVSFNTTAARPEPKSVYTDSTCSDYGLVGFEATDSKFAALLPGGELMVGGLDGSGMRKVGAFKAGNVIPFVDGETLAGSRMYVLTSRDYEGRLKQSILSMPLSGGTQSKVLEFNPADAPPKNLASDGKNIFYSQGNKVFMLAGGAGNPSLLSDNFGSVDALASDGKSLVVEDSKRGALYAIKNLSATPTQVKVLAIKNVQSIAVGNGKVYFGTHVIANRKNAGVVASVAIP
jgi:hypothetical protein